jgi:AcrR family transcriptional regulator
MKGTEERILAAATRAFARHGVTGATTREIARQARVNEVTLFRHFKNKNELLRRVMLQSARRFEPVFSDAASETAADLRGTVENYAAVYARKLSENEEFVRTFLGEMTRQPKLCRSLFVEAGRQVRQKFIAYLRAAQRNGLVRADLDVPTAADALSGMLLGGIMRRPLTAGEYETKSYVKTCVKLYLQGIQP